MRERLCAFHVARQRLGEKREHALALNALPLARGETAPHSSQLNTPDDTPLPWMKRVRKQLNRGWRAIKEKAELVGAACEPRTCLRVLARESDGTGDVG